MSYMHIDNLYKNQTIPLFRECYAMEKIHGTSAHVRWDSGQLSLFSGGEKHDRFCRLFDQAALTSNFEALGHPAVTVYGEAYGGKQQGQSWRYGPDLRFIAFEVQIGDLWLDVPKAESVVAALGLEFVHYRRIGTDLPSIDAERDAPSEQARRNGVDGDKPREGVVLRPLVEVKLNNGSRVIAKHKRDEERETKTPRPVDASKAQVLADAQAIADEWVTPTRMSHVLDKLGEADITRTKDVIVAMTEDVIRESKGEIVDSREARAAIGRATAQLFKQRLQEEFRKL